MSIDILGLLNSGNYQIYNRKVAKALGSIGAAIMLAELVNRYQYHKERDELLTFDKHEGEWFYYTLEKCEERTVFTRSKQDSAIQILQKHNLVEKAQIGLPSKRNFRLNLDAITAFEETAK